MLLKCTPDGRRIKVNGLPVSQGNVARGECYLINCAYFTVICAKDESDSHSIINTAINKVVVWTSDYNTMFVVIIFNKSI